MPPLRQRERRLASGGPAREPDLSGHRRLFVVPNLIRAAVAELNAPRPRAASALAAAAWLLGSALLGASAAGATGAAPTHARVPAPRTPATAVHTEFLVEVNAKGQVTRVRSGKSCPDLAFNAMTYGNALQAFIRTPDGRSISGLYRLSYDYNPKTKRVARAVALIHAGGVDPNRIGAVDEMALINARHHPQASPTPAGSPLPDFKAITGHRH